MSGPLSATLEDIHMIRMETDVVVPIRPMFYKRFVVDIYNRRQKNTVNKLCDGLNNYRPKVKLTIETNPLRFLDIETIHNNGMIETRINRKKTKFPTPWTSNITKRDKRNTIKAELHRAKRISSNFINEVKLIKKTQQIILCVLLIAFVIHEFTTAQTNYRR